MSLSIEAHIRKLLDADKVCMGKVSAATVRQLALQFAREPEPDSDVLAERSACLAQLRSCQARLTMHAADEDGDFIATEVRRVGEAIHSIELGLHRASAQGGSLGQG